MKVISLISSGIDSPVATYLLSKSGMEIILVHGDNRPFTDDNEIENFNRIIQHLKKKIPGLKKAYLVPHGHALSTYKKECNTKFTCIFCKRMLVRYAERIAEQENADAIVMGDSLGQVASQTLQNIRVVEEAVSLPILRPLIGFDKNEIIQIAKHIGTYELSILPTQGCQAVPKKPSTRAPLAQILEEEQKIDIKTLVDNAVEKAQVVLF